MVQLDESDSRFCRVFANSRKKMPLMRLLLTVSTPLAAMLAVAPTDTLPAQPESVRVGQILSLKVSDGSRPSSSTDVVFAALCCVCVSRNCSMLLSKHGFPRLSDRSSLILAALPE